MHLELDIDNISKDQQKIGERQEAKQTQRKFWPMNFVVSLNK